jgi:hypothetical protein
VKNPFRRQCSKESRYVEWDVDGGNDEVQATGYLFQDTVALGVVDLVRAKLARLLFLTITGGESVDALITSGSLIKAASLV